MNILVARLYICAFSNKKLLAHANVSRNKLFSNEIVKSSTDPAIQYFNMLEPINA